MSSAEKISVTMPSEMVRAIHESVAAGEFASTSEAMRDAVRVWRDRRHEDAERLTAIRARIRRSLDDPRPDLTLDEVDASLVTLFGAAEKASGDAAS